MAAGYKETLSWDGETIRSELKVDDRKFTPKEFLVKADYLENQIEQLKNQLKQIERQKEMFQEQLKEAEESLSAMAPFREDCKTKQFEKLQEVLAQIKDECLEKAKADAQAIIDKDPSAYTADQARNQRYVIYQKLLATHEKMSNKVAPKVIAKHLYEEPVFENPFLGDNA